MKVTLKDIENAIHEAANNETQLYNALYDALNLLRVVIRDGKATALDKKEFDRLTFICEQHAANPPKSK